jgi:hypothetical protein
MSADPTADAGIDIRQRWRETRSDDHFTVLRTYRDNPINPSFLIEFEAPREESASRGKTTVTLRYFEAYCERADEPAQRGGQGS